MPNFSRGTESARPGIPEFLRRPDPAVEAHKAFALLRLAAERARQVLEYDRPELASDLENAVMAMGAALERLNCRMT